MAILPLSAALPPVNLAISASASQGSPRTHRGDAE